MSSSEEEVARISLETWDAFGLPAAESGYELMVEARGALAAEDAGGTDLIERRLAEFNDALARMTRWTDERMTGRTNGLAVPGELETGRGREGTEGNSKIAEEGLDAFEDWYRSYLGGIAAVLWCDACGQLRLHGSRMVAPYARWKRRHRALRAHLAPDRPRSAAPDALPRLVDEIPFRRRLCEAGTPSPSRFAESRPRPIGSILRAVARRKIAAGRATLPGSGPALIQRRAEAATKRGTPVQ